MGILAPLFLIGLGALSLPVILHLVRRTPTGRQEFSSLMFLRPTPPRLTRRSRFDQILLLLLRLAALALLALAFTRPFLRESALLTLNDLPRRRVAILLDTSASMQRPGLWQQAQETARGELDNLAPHDDVALYAFADHLQTITPFPSENVTVGESAVEIARGQLKTVQPTWQTGNLGVALTTLAGELDAASDVQNSLAEPQIVVISDFQAGTRIDALTAFDWPSRVRVIAKPVAIKKVTNASVQLLTQREEAEDAEPRVRVANAADSAGDQFFVNWAVKEGAQTKEVAVYVPPGESRVVRLPRNESSLQSDRIVLRGDDQDFDNNFYVVPPRKQELDLFYLGSDAADDPEGLRYYLQLACQGDPLRQVTLREWTAEDPSPGKQDPRLFVATRKLSPAEQAQLRQVVERGSTLLLVLPEDAATEDVSGFFDNLEVTQAKERSEDEFALLGEIDFTHPLFAPLSGPRYNDFTKIHFWQHRSLSLKPDAAAHVVAKFDNGQPWLIERKLGQGTVLLASSSWTPGDSQLAVSSKFVPVVGNLLDLACGSTKPLEGVTVGMPVPLANTDLVTTPSGMQVPWSDEQNSFTQTDEPGIYHFGSNESPQAFAVNLHPSESDTALLPLEQLDQLGVRRAAEVSAEERLTRMRQQRDSELESRQKVWRYLLVGCLLVLIGETWWAGHAARPAAKDLEVAA